MSVNASTKKATTKPQAVDSAEKTDQVQALTRPAAADQAAAVSEQARSAPAVAGDKFRVLGNGFFKTTPNTPSTKTSQAPANGAAMQAARNAQLASLCEPMSRRADRSGAAEAPSNKQDGAGQSAPQPSGARRALDASAAVLSDRLRAAAPDAGSSTQAASPTSESHAPVGNLDQPVLDQKIKDGKVEAKDFERMSEQQKATTIASMSEPKAENITKRNNLMRLMQDPSFSTHLTAALNQMEPAQRLQFINTVGEKTTGSNQGTKEASKIEQTLHNALGDKDMTASLRNDMLKDALLNGSSAAKSAVNSLLETSASSAVSLLESVASTPDLGAVFNALGETGQRTALSWVAGCSGEGKVRELFQNFAQGDPKTRETFETRLGELSDNERRSLFCKVMTDPSGSQPGQSPNAGQRLVANYFEGKDGAAEVKKLLDGVAELPDREGKRVPFENFIKQNVKNVDALRAADKPNPKAGEWAHLGTMDKEEVGKLIQAKSPSSDFTNFDYKHPDRLKMIDSVAEHGGPAAKAMLAAGIADSMIKDDPSASEKTAARVQIAKLLKEDPNAVLREMQPTDVKTMLMGFIQPPPDLQGLKEILPRLNGHSAAVFAEGLRDATNAMTASIKAGSWSGDLLKGIKVSGEYEHGGAKAGIEFSLEPLVAGTENRKVNDVITQVNDFLSDWTPQLNQMSANQKAIFDAELGDKVTRPPRPKD